MRQDSLWEDQRMPRLQGWRERAPCLLSGLTVVAHVTEHLPCGVYSSVVSSVFNHRHHPSPELLSSPNKLCTRETLTPHFSLSQPLATTMLFLSL